MSRKVETPSPCGDWNYYALGRAVKAKADAMGFGRNATARSMGCSTTTVYRLFRGTEVTASVIARAIIWVGISPEEFLPKPFTEMAETTLVVRTSQEGSGYRWALTVDGQLVDSQNALSQDSTSEGALLAILKWFLDRRN